MKLIRKLVEKNLSKRGMVAINQSRLDYISSLVDFNDILLRKVAGSHSQLYQDLFVLLETNSKRGGFFVEFGATDGVSLSNTYILEKKYEWHGILVEPARCWHRDIFLNRSSKVDTRCVWSKSGKTIEFNETRDPELSTIDRFSYRDDHAFNRKDGEKYSVQTVTLLDLLRQHNAPKVIDYLSIDTEGSEFDILSNFDFDKFDIKIITCEHNYTDNREKIFSLLSDNGYTRKHHEVSQFDDWYVKC
jgi:FkbM family methyltransferase